MNNTPTLMQSEEKIAPWNERTRIIPVSVSQCLSAVVEIEVPENFNESDKKDLLEDFVREQIILPHEVINNTSRDFWSLDDFCVSL